MNLFYAPDTNGENHMLPEDESKHLVRVLRLQTGDTVHLTDGLGNIYTALLVDAHPKRCLLTISKVEREVGKRDYSISIAIAPTKNIDRFEWFLEKCTEIGIDNIYPIICDRSERKIIKPDRLNRVITAAMKQSLKAYHPELHDQLTFDQFQKLEIKADKFIAHCVDGEKQLLKSLSKSGNDTCILIGPEGDFSDREITKAMDNCYLPVSLGDSRLRTETAGVVACHTLALINQ